MRRLALLVLVSACGGAEHVAAPVGAPHAPSAEARAEAKDGPLDRIMRGASIGTDEAFERWLAPVSRPEGLAAPLGMRRMLSGLEAKGGEIILRYQRSSTGNVTLMWGAKLELARAPDAAALMASALARAGYARNDELLPSLAVWTSAKPPVREHVEYAPPEGTTLLFNWVVTDDATTKPLTVREIVAALPCLGDPSIDAAQSSRVVESLVRSPSGYDLAP